MPNFFLKLKSTSFNINTSQTQLNQHQNGSYPIYWHTIRKKVFLTHTDIYEEEEEEKVALFMKRIINFQQIIRCKEVLLRKDWRIINLLRVAGLQEDGPG